MLFLFEALATHFLLKFHPIHLAGNDDLFYSHCVLSSSELTI